MDAFELEYDFFALCIRKANRFAWWS